MTAPGGGHNVTALWTDFVTRRTAAESVGAKGQGDSEQLGRARRQWSGLKSAGHALTYWAEDAQGRWAKQA